MVLKRMETSNLEEAKDVAFSGLTCWQCIGGDALATILTMFVEEYGERTGGIPDLWYAVMMPPTSSPRVHSR